MGGSHPGGDSALQDRQSGYDHSQVCSFAIKCGKQGLPAQFFVNLNTGNIKDVQGPRETV